jgi:protein involved in polysaccharide export with SLBB domain
LLGLIRVTGWTTEEIQADLTAHLSAGYLKNPRVNVSIARHRNLYVSGEVKAEGAYPYEEGLTVQKAITMAGGFTEKASRTPKVLRTIDGKERTIEMALDAPVLPDDIIVISQRFFRFIYLTRFTYLSVRNPGDWLRRLRRCLSRSSDAGRRQKERSQSPRTRAVR